MEVTLSAALRGQCLLWLGLWGARAEENRVRNMECSCGQAPTTYILREEGRERWRARGGGVSEGNGASGRG